MTPDLAAYLDRIGFAGPLQVDLATLTGLCRAHVNAIPFENLDVQLGRQTARGAAAVHAKLVAGGRGGWCYEQNTLMGWALGEIGFDVTRLCAGVMREQAGDGQVGNHLCLRIDLDGPWLVDVGFGSSLAGPIPLAAGTRHDAPFHVALSQTDDGYWRFVETLHGAPFSFDFISAPADESLLDATRIRLETHAASPFVENLVVRRRDGERHHTLRGKVLTTASAAGLDKRVLATADELVDTLDDVFAIEMDEAATLWPAISARHDALFPAA
jgi:N-hydroxyarylamine O-acetyltransferase